MGPFEIVLLISGILSGLALLIVLLYALVLVRPGKKTKPSPALMCDYAHRGLHGNGVPENSLAAFELAAKNGYGIELDVQLSRDGVVMVFHDYTLNRVTGVDKKLCDLDAAELGKITLSGTDQTIPTFTEVLQLVDGRVPLLVELKGEDLNVSLCKKVADILLAYKGEYCIESFNPLLVMEMKKHLPHVCRGQLYTNTLKDMKKRSALHVAISLMAFNFLAKPDFIAYNKIYRKSLPVWLTTKLYRAPRFVWTTKGESETALARSLGEFPIFEINKD